MKRLNFFLAGILTVALMAGCSPDYPSAPDDELARITTSGTADFTRFAVAGNSLTAGTQNNGLSQQFQLNSYGALIARQLGIADAGALGSEWEQPLVADPGTSGILTLDFATTKPTPVTNPSNNFINLALAQPYDNLGIPSCFLYDFLNAADTNTSWTKTRLGKGNPLFATILRGIGTQFNQLKTLQPTFVIWWEGHNDILGYATSGAGLNGNFQGIAGVPPYTPLNSADPLFPVFGYNFNDGVARSLDSLQTLGADVVIGNIPDVTAIAYFTALYPGVTFPTKDSVVVNAATGAKAAVYYQETKDSIQFLCLGLGSSIGVDSGGTGIPYGLHPLRPVGGQYTLTFAEVRNIQTIITSYNTSISTAAAARNIPVADFYALFNDIKTSGRTLDNGTVVGAAFLSGGLFSLDGVHPASLGYAIVANTFIDRINAFYGSAIPRVNEAAFVSVQ